MNETAVLEPMTTEQLLALPDDDDVERQLIRGQLLEGPVMSRRSRQHSRLMTKLAKLLDIWASKLPEPRGEVLTGDGSFRLRRRPDSTVGIDIAYMSAEVAAANPDFTSIIDGIPILAVEILSPSDEQERITNKIREYLDVGVPLVWIVEPVFHTVTVYRPDRRPELFNEDHELVGDPFLAGFRVRVSEVFQR